MLGFSLAWLVFIKSFGGCRRRLAWAGLDWTLVAWIIGRAPSAYPFPCDTAGCGLAFGRGCACGHADEAVARASSSVG